MARDAPPGTGVRLLSPHLGNPFLPAHQGFRRSRCGGWRLVFPHVEHVVDTRGRAQTRAILAEGARPLGPPFLRPVLVSFLDAIGQYPYSPERSFGQREFARILESVGYRVEERTGLLAFPGVIRLVELLLLRRKVKWPRLFSLVRDTLYTVSDRYAGSASIPGGNQPESRRDEGRVAPGDRTPQGVREPGV